MSKIFCITNVTPSEAIYLMFQFGGADNVILDNDVAGTSHPLPIGKYSLFIAEVARLENHLFHRLDIN